MTTEDRIEDILSKHISPIPQGLLSDLAAYVEMLENQISLLEYREDLYIDSIASDEGD